MGSTTRYILSRVCIGLLIGAGMFYFRSAHAQGFTCPSTQTISYYNFSRASISRGDWAGGISPACPTGATMRSVSDLNACWITPPRPPNPAPGFLATVYTFVSAASTLASSTGVYTSTGTYSSQNIDSTGANSGAPSTTTVTGLTITPVCAAPTCPAAGTPYGLLVSANFGSGGDFCDRVSYPNCSVISQPYLTISAGSASGGGTGYDISYSGKACPSTQPTAGPPVESANIVADDQTFQLTRGTVSFVNWVNNNIDVPLTVTDTNRSTANNDNSIIRQSTSDVPAPNNANPITITFIRDGNRITQVFTPTAITNSTNLTNVRNQSGGPAGGNGPANQPLTTTGTRTNGDGSTTTITNVYNTTTTTVTITNTTPAPPGSPPGTAPTTNTTTTIINNNTGEQAPQSINNRNPPNQTTGGGGGPEGDPDTDGGGGECTGTNCGTGAGGGEGAFTGKGGTARGFSESVDTVKSAWNTSPAMTAMAGASIPAGGTCPQPAIAMPYLNKTIVMTAHCEVADTIRTPLRAVFLAMWTIIAIGTFFRA